MAQVIDKKYVIEVFGMEVIRCVDLPRAKELYNRAVELYGDKVVEVYQEITTRTKI